MPLVAKFHSVSAALLLSTLALLAGGCCRAVGALAGAASENFAGNYMSNWGLCSFTQSGVSVNGSCARGTTLSCVATGAVLSCDWREKAGGGKATLTKQTNGSLVGTWGSGNSSINGGSWNFAPQK